MNINNNLTPAQWLGYLKQIDEPQEKEHRYLVITQEGKSYQVLTPQELKAAGTQVRKLSVNEIITISKDIFQQAEQAYSTTHASQANSSSSFGASNSSSSTSADAQTLIELKLHISRLGKRLLATRDKKRNQLSKQMMRGMGWALTMTPGLGKPIETWLQKSQNDFETQKLQLEKALRRISESETTKEVDKRLKLIPKIVLEAKKNINKKEIILFLTKHIERNKNDKAQNQLCVALFEKDLKRGVTFLRTDAANKITDAQPIPFQDLEPVSKVAMGVAALAELTEKLADKPWQGILQAAATQTSITPLMDSLQGQFLESITSDSWQEGEQFKSLVLDFGDNLPSIHLEIIRDPDISAIETVKVEIKALGSIVKKTPGSEEKGEMIFSEVISAHLTYYIRLKNFDELSIHDLTIDLTSKI